MFVTFIPRASFPVSRQPSPTLQIFSIKRYVGSYDRRSPPPVPIDARQILSHSTCARNCGRTTMCLWTGSRKLSATKTSAGSFFGPPPQTRQFLRADSQAAFRWPTLRQSLGGPFRFAVERVSFSSAPFCTARHKKRPNPTNANRNADQKRQEYRDPTQPRQRSLCRSRC